MRSRTELPATRMIGMESAPLECRCLSRNSFYRWYRTYRSVWKLNAKALWCYIQTAHLGNGVQQYLNVHSIIQPSWSPGEQVSVCSSNKDTELLDTITQLMLSTCSGLILECHVISSLSAVPNEGVTGQSVAGLWFHIVSVLKHCTLAIYQWCQRVSEHFEMISSRIVRERQGNADGFKSHSGFDCSQALCIRWKLKKTMAHGFLLHW